MTLHIPAAPQGSATVNPFIWTDDAARLIDFLVSVFEATEVVEARTADSDGLVLHSENVIGDSTVTVADRKPGWPYTPAFVRVYVEDPGAVLARAEEHGGRIVTQPTDFFGDVLSRFADPFGHLWWVYKHHPGAATWDAVDAGNTAGGDRGTEDSGESWASYTSPELEYIHSTLVQAMSNLRDPRA